MSKLIRFIKYHWNGWYFIVFCLVGGSIFHVLNHIKYGSCGCFVKYFIQ